MTVASKEIKKLQEVIPTGLTANYLPNWTVLQGLKEAMQNIAYGSIKSGKKAKLYLDPKENMMAIKDRYTGFEKKYLYIGESEQRDDKDGLGNFGEGWKLFLLIMARNNIRHMVKTAGFTFYGEMKPTQHGTDVLYIIVDDNNQTEGTRVYCDVSEDLWIKATKSFAVLNDIDHKYTVENCVIPNRFGELWVQGVRIENGEDENPLNLHYAYNLQHRDLMNRDRSHVNTHLALSEIKRVIFNMDEEWINQFVLDALGGNLAEDIQAGPYIPLGESEQRTIWKDVLATLHATEPSKLVIPSYNTAVNDEAKKRGFILLDTPRKWDSEIAYLGISKADDIIDDRYDVVEEGYHGGGYMKTHYKTAFSKVKNKLKKAFALSSYNELPEFVYVQEIKNPVNGESKIAHYDSVANKIYVDTSYMDKEANLLKAIFPEMFAWKYGALTFAETNEKYQEIILRLLKVID